MKHHPPRRCYWLVLASLMISILSVVGCVHGFTTGSPLELFVAVAACLAGLGLLLLGRRLSE